MKKLLPLFVLIGLSISSFSQDCKYEVNEVDKFSGDTIKELKLVDIAKKIKKEKHYTIKKVKSAFKRSGNNYQFILFFVLKPGSNSVTFFNNTKGTVLFNNGQKIDVSTTKLPDMNATGGGFSYKFIFNITKTDLELFMNNLITDFRIIPNLNNEPFDISFESDKATKVKAQTRCL